MYGLGWQTVRWIKNWLSGKVLMVVISGTNNECPIPHSSFLLSFIGGQKLGMSDMTPGVNTGSTSVYHLHL